MVVRNVAFSFREHEIYAMCLAGWLFDMNITLNAALWRVQNLCEVQARSHTEFRAQRVIVDRARNHRK